MNKKELEKCNKMIVQMLKRTEEAINGLFKVIDKSCEEETHRSKTYVIDDLEWSKTFDKMDWEDAVEFAEKINYAGYSDWRLPTRTELLTLIDDKKYNPACKIDECDSSYYWSSTTDASYAGYAWRVYFNNGYVDSYNKTNNYYVRCVRGGQ